MPFNLLLFTNLFYMKIVILIFNDLKINIHISELKFEACKTDLSNLVSLYYLSFQIISSPPLLIVK